jgi:hypothetical protein
MVEAIVGIVSMVASTRSIIRSTEAEVLMAAVGLVAVTLIRVAYAAC